MKIQDVVFILALLLLLYKNDNRWLALAGLACIALSIPLFSLWIFFTAERLTWYASVFFLSAIIIDVYRMHRGTK